MRSTFKVLFYVNGSKEKNGIVPIMGRVTINGSVAQFSCKLTIAKTMWDAKGNRAKGQSSVAFPIIFFKERPKLFSRTVPVQLSTLVLIHGYRLKYS